MIREESEDSKKGSYLLSTMYYVAMERVKNIRVIIQLNWVEPKKILKIKLVKK